jgi:CRP-like cAMP-binding protein
MDKPENKLDSPLTSHKISEAIIDFLINIPIFDKVKGSELRTIAKHMNITELRPREILFKEGDKGDYVCFVVDGSLEVIKKTAKDTYVTLTKMFKGRSIGEMAIIDDFPRSATVKALTHCTLVILTRRGFDLILEEHPTIGVKILKGIARLLSQSLRQTSSRLVDYIYPIE